jgi:TonB family protein
VTERSTVQNGLSTTKAWPTWTATVGACVLATSALAADGPQPLSTIPSFTKAADILGRAGPKETRAKAVPILEAVAKRGDARAQVMLGAVLLQGELQPQDKIAGYSWLQIGKASGDGPYDATTQSKAGELMRKVEPGMSGSELIKADQITQRFLAERQERLDDGIAQAGLFYVGELPTASDLNAFASDPAQVKAGLAPVPGGDFMLGCAKDSTLSGCSGIDPSVVAQGCQGTIYRSTSKPIDTRDRSMRLRLPAYPVAARRAGLEGDARLVMHVDGSGWICSVKLAVSSSVDVLDQAAMQGARRWRVNPGVRDGKPVESLQTVVVSFALEGYEFE